MPLAAALLAVEFLDELVSGAWTTAWPYIRSDLDLTYVQVGLLLALPALFANLIEPAIGLLGDVWNRRTIVRAGAVVYLAAMLLCVASTDFLPLLLALFLWYPAGGAFIGLSQVVLVEATPSAHERSMAQWGLAGSLGMLAGPAALGIALAASVGWRAAFLGFAAVGLAVILAVWRTPIGHPPGANGDALGRALRNAARDALRALRRREVRRWLALLEFSDLMLDVLHGYLALYLVDVVGVSGAKAAFAIGIWTGVGLAGDALLIPLLKRVDGVRYLRASALATLVVFPAFLLAQGTAAKFLLLGLLGLLNSGWYAILKGRLYAVMPGHGGTVMALGNVANMAGALLPFAVGLAAQHLGLGMALWFLLAGPCALLAGLPRSQAARR